MTTATKAKKKGAQAAPAQAANGHDVNGLTGTAVDGEVTVKPEPKAPGEKGFDWQAEYPDEQVFVYTVPKGVKDNGGNDIGGQVGAPRGYS